MNGADDIEREEHAVIGGKARRLLTSLPGNHDVGFGSGVQLAVRDRFASTSMYFRDSVATMRSADDPLSCQ